MSLPPKRDEFPVQPDRLVYRVGQTAGSGHMLIGPIECGGRWWVFCRCGWLFSADRADDVPARCEIERTLFDAEQTLAMVERIAARERRELQNLLVRRPVLVP